MELWNVFLSASNKVRILPKMMVIAASVTSASVVNNKILSIKLGDGTNNKPYSSE
jgi:hypothetical protein